MKKLILFALTLVLIGTLFTACRWGNANDTTAPTDTSAATTQPTTAPRPTVPDNIPDDNMSDPSGNSTEATTRRRMIDNRS